MPGMKSRFQLPALGALSALLVGSLVTGCGPHIDHLSITNPSGPVPLGATVQFVGIATFSDGVDHYLNTDFIWTSDNPAIASVGANLNEQGLVTGNAKGTTTIRIAMVGYTAALPTQVVDPVVKVTTLKPTQATVKVGATQRFLSERLYTDGKTEDRSPDATWTSSNPAVATISQGLATAVAAGTTLITATDGDFKATATLTVN